MALAGFSGEECVTFMLLSACNTVSQSLYVVRVLLFMLIERCSQLSPPDSRRWTSWKPNGILSGLKPLHDERKEKSKNEK